MLFRSVTYVLYRYIPASRRDSEKRRLRWKSTGTNRGTVANCGLLVAYCTVPVDYLYCTYSTCTVPVRRIDCTSTVLVLQKNAVRVPYSPTVRRTASTSIYSYIRVLVLSTVYTSIHRYNPTVLVQFANKDRYSLLLSTVGPYSRQ